MNSSSRFVSRVTTRLLFIAAVLVAAVDCGDDEPQGDGSPDTAPDIAVDASDDSGSDSDDLSGDSGEDQNTDVAADLEPDLAPDPTGEGIFAEGCPVAGQSRARLITVPAFFDGLRAVGTADDYLLMNEEIAVIINGPDRHNAYYYYGGIIVDAVPIEGCNQSQEDKFDEVSFIVGQLDLLTFESSVLRGFRADSAEVINDGRNGEAAVLRMTGSDDSFWLVEYEIMRRASENNVSRSLSSPFGIEVVVDYILPPGSNLVQIDLSVRNLGDANLDLLAGGLMTIGDTLSLSRYADSSISFGGFNLATGIPWLGATDGGGAYAFGIVDGNMAYTRISGVDVALDLQHALGQPLRIGPAGGDIDTDSMTFFFGVGDGDGTTPLRDLPGLAPQPMPGGTLSLNDYRGQVVDAILENGLANAVIDYQMQASDDGWDTLLKIHPDETGNIDVQLPTFSGTRSYRFRTAIAGRDVIVSAEWSEPSDAPTEIQMGPSGEVDYYVTDGIDVPSPARLEFYRSADGHREVHDVFGDGLLALPPGTYDVSMTRGFEFEPVYFEIDVPTNGTVVLNESLLRVVNTSGFMSADSHVHAAPSPDSQVLPARRFLNAAAHGLEIVISTDHRIITDISYGIDEANLRGYVNHVIGMEMTATVPEHNTMFPAVPDGTPRGGVIEWWGLDLAENFEAQHERGAEVVILNHPRNGCNYLCLTEWDRISGEAQLTDPTRLGLAEDAALWSWDFEGVEYMNGFRNPFVNPSSPEDTGLFEDWQAFLNHGHAIVAVGSSDAHGLGDVGFPCTYFASSTDDPAEFDEDEMVAAYLDGAVMVSGGAFARVDVNGEAQMGDTITDQDGAVTFNIQLQAVAQLPVTDILVFANCDQVAHIETTTPNEVVKFDGSTEITLTQDAHITMVAFGDGTMPWGLPQYNTSRTPVVTTNAIYVDFDGNGEFDAPGGKTCTYTIP